MRAYLALVRPLNTLMVFSAAVLAGIIARASPSCFLPAAVGAALVSAGAQAINDYYDYGIDRRKGKRHALRKRDVLLASVVLYALGVLASLLASPLLALLALLAALLSWAYSSHLRAVKYLGNVVVALLTAFVFIFAGICGEVWRVLFPFLLSFLVSWAREVMKDIEDLPADRGHKTTLPMIVGEEMAGYFSAYLLLLGVFFSVFPGPLGFGIFSSWYYYLLLPATLLFILSALYVIRRRPREAQRLCKAGMLVALLAFAAGTLLP